VGVWCETGLEFKIAQPPSYFELGVAVLWISKKAQRNISSRALYTLDLLTHVRGVVH